MATKTVTKKKSAPAKAAAPKHKVLGPEDGRADFEALAAEYKKVPKAKVNRPRTDVQAAITHALGIAQRVAVPALRKRFLAMPDEQLPTLLDQLPRAARAARYAFLRLSTTTASTQTTKVSPAIVQESTAVRARMLAVCDYLLGDQPEYAAELSAIRQDRGYQDLADDLERLADLYDQEAEVVKTDAKNYRAGDRVAAQTLASQILVEVAASDPTAAADAKGGKVPAARGAAYRAFAFLVFCYDEVAAAGRYLLRHEDGDAIFCSLFAAGRKKQKSRRPPSAPPQPSPATT